MAKSIATLPSRAFRHFRAELAALPGRLAWQPFSQEGDPQKPGLLINSVPKSGTYLLGKLANLLGFHELNIHFLNDAYWDYNRKGVLHKWDALKGCDSFVNPRYVRQSLRASFRRIRSGQYAVAHTDYHTEAVEAIAGANLKHVFIFRDPRDVIVSYVQFVTNRPDRNPPLKPHEYFTRVLENDDQRIEATMRGAPDVQGNMMEFLIGTKDQWQDDPATCCVHFEDLVGKQGGGSEERQRKAVRRVVDYLELPNGESLCDQAAENLFGGNTHTFNKGQIGRWRDVFTPRHVAIFKELSGDLLVRLGYEQDENW